MRRLNVKLLAGLVVGTAAVGAAVHFLHGFQMGRNAQAFLKNAGQAEAEGRTEQEIKWLRHYLACVPKDVEALARYGLALKTLATSDHQRLQVVDILERVLQRRPERHDVRRPLANLLMDLGRFG